MASSRVYSHVLGTPEIGSLSRTGQIKIPAAEQGGGAVTHFQLQFGQVFEVGGVVTSRMHMAWMKVVCGRLKSDYRYTRDLCYNTFYWPEGVPLSQKQKIESAAQEVLDVRSQYNDCSLATLYNPETMPYELLQAHRKLYAAVEKAYGRKFADNAERVAFLFGNTAN